MAVEFRQIEKKTGDDMFSAPAQEGKWTPIINALLLGKDVFVPDMTRTQLETVRGIIRTRKYGTLRSRTTAVDDRPGKLLRIIRGR